MGNFRARHLIHCSGEQPNSERCFAHRTSSRGPPEGWGGRKVGERRGGGVSGGARYGERQISPYRALHLLSSDKRPYQRDIKNNCIV